MKNTKAILILLAIAFSVNVAGQITEKYISTKSHIKFFSSTPVEDIEANNYASISTLNTTSGTVIFSVPMQSFEFKKALMQKHFNNEHFLETDVYPKSKFKGTIINVGEIDFSKDGTYKAEIEGKLSIRDKTTYIEESGTIEVKGGLLIINSKFDITLIDFGIGFDETEMVSKKIAKTIEISVKGEYSPKL